MHWTEIARFDLTDEWQWSAPVEGALFRVRHLNQVESRGFLAQLFLDGSRLQLLEMTRIRSQNEAQLFTLFAPDDLADRRIAARLSSTTMEGWEIAIDVMEAETPIESDNLLDLLTAALTAHSEDSDPHPQYVTANDLADAVAAVNNLVATREAIGVAATGLTAHTNSIDPHPQYATDSALTTAVSSLTEAIATKENTGTTTSALVAHASAADPHPQYVTDADMAETIASTDQTLINQNTRIDIIADEVMRCLAAWNGHNTTIDPHPRYLMQANLETALATIRGYWEFRQTAKPTTRPDSSSLVTGDRWLDADYRWWFWNGTYWLSEQIERVWVVPGLGGNANLSISISSQYNVFLLDFRVHGVFVGPQDLSNYWEFGLERVTDGTLSATPIGSPINTSGFNFASASQARRLSQDINQFFDLQSLNVGVFRVLVRRIGSTGTSGSANCQVRFRHAR